MIKDLLVSFRDNFKEKSTNPFLGTYFIVWLIRNWELVYTVFNFDKDMELKDKVDFIKNYYSQHEFIENIVTNIYWAFGLLIATYILLNVSRLIINFSEKKLTPLIYRITDSKSIVLRGEYERIRIERDDLQTRLDQERESKSKLEIRIKNLEAEIIEITSVKSEKSNQELVQSTSVETESGMKDDFSILLQKIKDRGLLNDFLQVVLTITKSDYISNTRSSIDFYLELGLLKVIAIDTERSVKKYGLTTDGENVFKRARLE